MTPLHWIAPSGSNAYLFPFLTLVGNLVPSRPNFDREIRQGTNGICIWLTGARGEPFQINTSLDCVSSAAAGAAFAAYHSSITTQKRLYYGDMLWGEIFVHNVTLTKIERFVNGSGGLQSFAGASGAMLSAAWTIETLYTN